MRIIDKEFMRAGDRELISIIDTGQELIRDDNNNGLQVTCAGCRSTSLARSAPILLILAQIV